MPHQYQRAAFAKISPDHSCRGLPGIIHRAHRSQNLRRGCEHRGVISGQRNNPAQIALLASWPEAFTQTPFTADTVNESMRPLVSELLPDLADNVGHRAGNDLGVVQIGRDRHNASHLQPSFRTGKEDAVPGVSGNH